MKTYMKIIIFSVIIGTILAIFFYKDIKKEVNAITRRDDIIYIFQVGVFTNVENALEFQKEYDYSIIYQDNEYYRVLVGVSTTSLAKEVLINYFNQTIGDYYIKEIRVNKDLINELASLESVILKTNKAEVIANINKSMLKTFGTYNN